jgi:hypothetical protein
MMIAQTDDNQFDGAGFSDGLYVAKTNLQFSDLAPAILGRLTPNTNWVGHVRKKSTGTSAGLLAAHPYEYAIPGRGKLILCHNGYIRGTLAIQDDTVNTDTYRAGRVLAGMLSNGAVLNKELIETWVAGFAGGSEWSFVIAFQGFVYIVRGQRTIYGLNIGDNLGVLFNTSEAVVRHAKSLLKLLYPDIKTSVPTIVPQHTLITIHPDGSMVVAPYTFTEKEKPSPAPYLWTSDEKGDVKTFA